MTPDRWRDPAWSAEAWARAQAPKPATKREEPGNRRVRPTRAIRLCIEQGIKNRDAIKKRVADWGVEAAEIDRALERELRRGTFHETADGTIALGNLPSHIMPPRKRRARSVTRP